MKFMKLGTSPDTFYTEDNITTLDNDVPSDITLHINNSSFHLHKYALLPKCGLLHESFDESSSYGVELHDVPGGEDAFELCVKFCYGIQIHISADNFVLAYCAAKFLQMTEIYYKGNFVPKLEAFFTSCILECWKDSIVALQSTLKLHDYADEVGVTRRCIDSIVDKILLPPPKVSWSFTYSRPGFEQRHRSVPVGWWTEDISNLDLELFRSVLVSVRATNILSPQLIGEALHVYASCNHLLPRTNGVRTPESLSYQQSNPSFEQKKQMLETITILIPTERCSVSVRFLLKLLSVAQHLDMRSSMKVELIRRRGSQLEDATVDDLLLVSSSSSSYQEFHDIELVKSVVENHLTIWRRRYALNSDDKALIRSIQNVGKLVDSFIQIVAVDQNIPVSDITSLAKILPPIARPSHDELYRAITIYLNEHPELPKGEKRNLCSILDCERLSHEVAAHAVKNELLPLRTVVQVLFFEQERAGNGRIMNEIGPSSSSVGFKETKSSDKNGDTRQSGNETPDDRGLRITEVGVIPRTQRKKFQLRHAVKKFIRHLT